MSGTGRSAGRGERVERAAGPGGGGGTGSGRARPDLRLAGVAVGMWLAAFWALHTSATVAVVGAGVAAAVGGLVGVGLARSSGHGSRRPGTGRRRDQTGRRGWAGRRWDRAGRRQDRAGRTAVGWAAVAVVLGMVCGALITAARTGPRDADPLASWARSRVVVRAEAELSDDPREVGTGPGPRTLLIAARLTDIRTATATAHLAVRVVIFATDPAWRGLLPSQRLAVRGTLGPARGGDLTAAVLSATGPPELIDRPSWTQRAAGRLRAGLREACRGLPPDAAGLLPGLVIGDTSGLDPELATDFRTTGLTHLVAVSGANVAILLGVVLFLARWCRARPLIAALACGLALVGFVILARPSPSVVRAAAMGAVGLLALTSGRRAAAAPALATAVVAGLVWDPGLAADVGFALSTLATGALILLAPRWRDALRARGVPAAVAEAVAVAAAAQLACGPLIVLLSGGISLVAVPANLLAAPAVAPASLLGVGAAVVSAVWPGGAHLLAVLAGWPTRWLVGVARVGAGIPGATLGWPSGPVGALALAVLTVLVLVALRRPLWTKWLAVAVVAVAVGAVPVRVATDGWPPPGTVLVVCDVGQGDALVLPVADHEAVVVDTGPDPAPVDGCLRRLGVRTVPLLVLTHFHLDHVGGITGVLRGRTLGAVLESPYVEPGEGYAAVARAVGAHPVITATLGWTYRRGPLSLTVLAPVQLRTGTRSDPNNNSVVLAAADRGVSMVLAGDAETEEQQDLLARDPAVLRAQVLKVAHHGSAYQDPAFLAAVAPVVAVVSVGAGNPYGHPSATMLTALARSGVRVLRTDLDGDIAIVATGHGPGVARAPT